MRAIHSDGPKAERSPKNTPDGPSQRESEARGLLRLMREEGFRIAQRSYVAGAVISTAEDGAALYVLTSGKARCLGPVLRARRPRSDC